MKKKNQDKAEIINVEEIKIVPNDFNEKKEKVVEQQIGCLINLKCNG